MYQLLPRLPLRPRIGYDQPTYRMRPDLRKWRARTIWYSPMTSHPRAWWRVALELRIRRSNGDSFQDFFSKMMEKTRGSDFVRVRAFGALGDMGCDGYVISSGEVFQCYGAVNGESNKAAYVVKKMEQDFATAKTKLDGVMKSWTFVHNLTDGLPVTILQSYTKLSQENPGIDIKLMGLEGFAGELFKLNDDSIGELLGLAAQAEDLIALQPMELRNLVSDLVQLNSQLTAPATQIKPVPVDKLELNKLPIHWHQLIQTGWQNSYAVQEYLSRYHDPLAGDSIAQLFRNHYAQLKAQNLCADDIMSHLCEVVVGGGPVAPSRQVAAFAIIAYFFESCDIFEDHASKVAP